MPADITFYIPCYNAGMYLDRCIKSILNQSHPIKAILVIDDGSTDDSVSLCAKYPVTVIRHSSNRGLSASRNTAIQNSKTEFLASADADIVLPPEWLAQIMPNFTGPEIAGVGGQLKETCVTSLADQWRNAHLRQWLGEHKIVNPVCIFGHSNVYRRQVLEEVHGYNPLLRTNGEDHDLTRKILQKGYTLIYEPAAVAFHLKSDTIRSIMITNWRYSSWKLLVNPLSWESVLKLLMEHISTGLRRGACDLLKLRLNLLVLDLAQVFFTIYHDFKLLYKKKRIK